MLRTTLLTTKDLKKVAKYADKNNQEEENSIFYL